MYLASATRNPQIISGLLVAGAVGLLALPPSDQHVFRGRVGVHVGPERSGGATVERGCVEL